MKNVSTAYVLWLACFLSPPIAGMHRLYNGKIGTGLLWLFTWGLFGVGQFVDLFLIPGMVEEHNAKLQDRLGVSSTGVPLSPPAIALTKQELTRDQLMVKLVKAAAARGGKLSVTQAVMDTGVSFAKAEATLKEMLKSGYVMVDNHPETGIVIYEFIEL
ncbi:NINE protein [Coleofasciculus sp. FACHB-64]|uniref:TM2 domain-containing protein n=1 Tax=Cyanophyceae TaxID=3028117 RepID=UPI0016890450|nr:MULTISPECIES: NINE protein [unclassified Coleofasciculus]MBD1841344.1 NINE protein [Coleofasciculus sp. FACHB-501]MBD1878924.1 NINE protein [Coleofasciculus sp. FACHB-T130]MBD1887898.1 NINE protein [Coleofasciculus sp. FACHB-SPT9]MBD2047913.1 NINE protein [Coleofasciculus sp. FACHB-64]MBD2084874.1 NINE protein [Coleofasciculus sp. FACHB-542]